MYTYIGCWCSTPAGFCFCSFAAAAALNRPSLFQTLRIEFVCHVQVMPLDSFFRLLGFPLFSSCFFCSGAIPTRCCMSVATLVPPMPRKKHATLPDVHTSRQLLWLALLYFTSLFVLTCFAFRSSFNLFCLIYLFFRFSCFLAVRFLFLFASPCPCYRSTLLQLWPLAPPLRRPLPLPPKRTQGVSTAPRVSGGVGRVGVRVPCFGTSSDCRTKSLNNLEGAVYGFS